MSIVGKFLEDKLGIKQVDLLHPDSTTAATIAQDAQTVVSDVATAQKLLTGPITTQIGTVITEIAPGLIAEIDSKIETAVQSALLRYGVPDDEITAAVTLIENELSILT